MNDAKSALHDNIQCYARDLLNGIDSPPLRKHLEFIIKHTPPLEASEALGALGAVLPQDWDHPLIESLFEFIEQRSIPRREWRGFITESKDYMGYGRQTSKWRFWLMVPRAFLRYKSGALRPHWF